jgi:Membrane-bound toxin component of toxin-antitoxin system
LSAKYSTSPSLRLQIADSRFCRWLQLGLFAACLCALGLVAGDGRPELAFLLLVPLFCSLPRLVGQPLAGATLAWRDGRWSLDRGCGQEPVILARGCRATPLSIYIRWQGINGERGDLWLFPDSGLADELRKLRVRLRLEG